MLLKSNCDERNFELHSNYFIEFYSCTIILNNMTYFNHINEIKHKYVIPNIGNESNHTNIFSFANITLPKIQKTQPIIEFHIKEPIIYFRTVLTILIIIFAIAFFIYIKCKPIPIIFINSIQENFEDNERGVIFHNQPTRNTHTHPQ